MVNRVNGFVALILVAIFAVAPASASVPQMKEWTFAVFINADNNLDQFGVKDQVQMSKVGTNDWLNIVTLIDRERGPASLNLIKKGEITQLKALGEVDMGDYGQLVEFMRFVHTNYPAKKYALVIWNHGSGWKHYQKNQIFRGISYDDSSGNHITLAQLNKAVRQIKGIVGRNLDILSMDACLMQMVEVVYEVKDACDYFIASEELAPGDGIPYDVVLGHLTKDMTPATLCKLWVDEFVKSYSGGSQGYDDATHSAIKISEFSDLIDAIDGFSKAIMSGNYHRELREILAVTQSFAYPENIDLLHFADLVKGRLDDISVQTAVKKLIAAANKAVLANGSHGPSLKNARGIAIYLPHDFAVEAPYKNLSFAKSTLWAAMMGDLYGRRVSDDLIGGLENGDLSELRSFVASATRADKRIRRFVYQKVSHRVHTEGNLPKNVKREAAELLRELNKIR